MVVVGFSTFHFKSMNWFSVDLKVSCGLSGILSHILNILYIAFIVDDVVFNYNPGSS